jgi:hypothetical protein
MLTGCATGVAGEASPAPPKPRVLIESQVYAFTEALADGSTNPLVRSLQHDLDARWVTGTTMREILEEQGRAYCANLIRGVPLDRVVSVTYPGAEDRPNAELAARLADQILCPS